MRLHRRFILALSVFSAAHFLTRNLFAAIRGTGMAGSADTLGAFLDILLPADADSPSATGIGVTQTVLARAESVPQFQRLIVAGTQWLDDRAKSQHETVFKVLASREQEQIVASMARARMRSLPRVFFDVLWEDAQTAYYSDPRSWPVLGYSGPPQPNGFPDHAAPPRGTTR